MFLRANFKYFHKKIHYTLISNGLNDDQVERFTRIIRWTK